MGYKRWYRLRVSLLYTYERSSVEATTKKAVDRIFETR